MRYDVTTLIALLFAAIAHAEGFWVPGSLPRRNHNPGDLLGKDGVNRQFPDILDGAKALYNQITLMLVGGSHVYTHAMTWRTVSMLWTGGDNAAGWCMSVCEDLGVDPDSTIADFVRVVTAPAPSTPEATAAA